MLSLLIASALLAQAPVPSVQTAPSQATAHFIINIPPIPAFGVETLHLTASRPLMPLTVTLTLDGRAEQMQDEEDLLAAINNERTSRGLGPLILDPLLSRTALEHCHEMCALNYFAHRSPTPGAETPIDRYLDALHATGEKRPAGALIGENIFYASTTNSLYNADYAHESLMASPSHRRNILEPRFTKVGVGLYRDPEGRFWVTEMFLRDSYPPRRN